MKNKDILRILSAYKIKTYQGKQLRVHYKDIYTILVRRVFETEYDDFEISKYLRTKMKNQWLEKHKKVKEIPKTGFKLHQSFASQIIAKYARRFKFRREQKALVTENQNFAPDQEPNLPEGKIKQEIELTAPKLDRRTQDEGTLPPIRGRKNKDENP